MMFYVGMALAALIGAFIQTVVGFGAAVCVLLYLTNFMTMTAAPSVASVVCLALNLSIVLQFRKSIRLRPILAPMLIYSGLSLLVVALVKNFEMTALTILFGVFLMAIAVYYLCLSGKLKIKENSVGMMLISSGFSGLFSGLFSIGGPTLSIYYLAICGSGDFYIASLQISFLIANIVLCAGRIANGLLTVDMIPTILCGLAGAVIGQIIGKIVRGRLSTERLSKLVYLAVGLSGVMVILQQVW